MKPPKPKPTDLPDESLARLLAVMAWLRDPVHGCPWDIEQTFRTIAPYTIEEAYEVADAIERGRDTRATGVECHPARDGGPASVTVPRVDRRLRPG